jgi:hypothetical protein
MCPTSVVTPMSILRADDHSALFRRNIEFALRAWETTDGECMLRCDSVSRVRLCAYQVLADLAPSQCSIFYVNIPKTVIYICK